MSRAPTPCPDPVASLEQRLHEVLPPAGLAAIPSELSEAQLRALLEQARTLIAETPLAQRLAVKTRMLGARAPFYRAAMATLPPTARHLKPFDVDNSGTLERSEIQLHMRESFGKTRWGAWKFAAMLYWLKLRKHSSITISEAAKRAAHASGSGNWVAGGEADQARMAENRAFLAGHADPFSTHALRELIELNTRPERNPGTRALERRIGRTVSMREYALAWELAGVEREDGSRVISAEIYEMNIDGTLVAMLFRPAHEAALVFRWRSDGELHYR